VCTLPWNLTVTLQITYKSVIFTILHEPDICSIVHLRTAGAFIGERENGLNVRWSGAYIMYNNNYIQRDIRIQVILFHVLLFFSNKKICIIYTPSHAFWSNYSSGPCHAVLVGYRVLLLYDRHNRRLCRLKICVQCVFI